LDGFGHCPFTFLSIPCSPSPSSSVINTEGCLSFLPPPQNPSLAAAQCRPVFGASSRLRWTVGTVSISSTLPRRQRSLVYYGRTFAPFGSCLATITIKDPAQATSTGLCRITPGDPALLLRVIQPLLVLTGLAAVLGQNFCCLLGLFGSLFNLPSTLSSPSSLLLSSLPPSVGPCRP
jgi:hypothetical protein